MFRNGIFITIIALSVSQTSLASAIPFAHTLSDSERSSLRYRLENLYNDVDLLIRNRRADEVDIRRQEETARYLKIYERIPFQPRLSEIRSELARSAAGNKFRILSFRFLPNSDEAEALTPNAFTDDRQTRLTPEQIAEHIRFRFVVEGDKDQVKDWIRGWPGGIMRLLEPEGGIRSPILQTVGGGSWEIEAWAFRFRGIRYPRLKLRDPRALLPEWAKNNPELFARQEPVLWSLVAKAEEDAPQAGELLPGRERFLLNDARLNFFFQKAGAGP